MTKASHRIKASHTLRRKGDKGRCGVDWTAEVYSEKGGEGRRAYQSEAREISDGRTSASLICSLSLPLKTPFSLLSSLPPSLPPIHPPSSSSCHYRAAPVNQRLLIQWHVGRGHVTYVKKRERGGLAGCVCVCVIV